MTPFPTVFTLKYSGVYVSAMNCGDETSDVEPPVDEALCFSTALSIPDIGLYNSHVRFGGHLDYSLFRSQDDIVEDVVAL